MPSPETEPETEYNGEDPGLLLEHGAEAPPEAGRRATGLAPRRSGWLWLRILPGLLVALPVLLTLAGALTSPPHVRGIPTGRLIYLEADEPSDHTALLRGLRVMGPDGASRQLLHETEPQDRDAGSREWISQPTASPDGRWLAFEKQVITLQEEEQSIDNQLWVMPLIGPGPPRMLLDLTKRRLKQFIGLAWTADSRNILFLNDGAFCTVPLAGGVLQGPRSLTPGAAHLRMDPQISATRNPGLMADGTLVYIASTIDKAAPLMLVRSHDSPGSTAGVAAAALSVSPDGRRIALPNLRGADVTGGNSHQAIDPLVECRWGWSVFGGRRITALKWSPDGRYLAYSVSKPPLEDELFYVDLATGHCSQLPVRTGRAGWDWAR